MPVIGIALIVIMMVGLASFLLGKIGELSTQNSSGMEAQQQLQNKLESLQKIDPSVLSESENVYLSLPDKNPAVYVVSQLKNYATEYGVALTKLNITGSSSQQAELGTATVQFSAEGEYQSVVDFINRLAQTAPLMSIERVKVTQSVLNTTEAVGALNTFWAPFPETLPSVTEGISNLTEEELKILQTLTSLEQPIFGDLPPAAPTQTRPNPFAVQ